EKYDKNVRCTGCAAAVQTRVATSAATVSATLPSLRRMCCPRIFLFPRGYIELTVNSAPLVDSLLFDTFLQLAMGALREFRRQGSELFLASRPSVAGTLTRSRRSLKVFSVGAPGDARVCITSTLRLIHQSDIDLSQRVT